MRHERQARWGESKTINICTILFVVVGVVVFLIFGKQWFPDAPGGGFNWPRVFWSGVVGAGSAMVGYCVGVVIDKLIKK
jgi:drug/metabolite transporter (DMT)-like permease